MNKRLLCLGLLAAVSQLFATGCIGHPVARWRANHPCLSCGPVAHPLLHPIQTRRVILGDTVGGHVIGPVVPPCHGCGSPGVPVRLSGAPYEGIPVTPTGYPPIGNPAIGYPIPITPGPTVVPSNPLPMPMPVPKSGN